MADDQHRAKEPSPKRANTWIVAVGLVCVAASIYYGTIENGLHSREQVDAINAQTAVMKNQGLQKFYEQKLAAYAGVTEAASRIAALKSAGAPAPQAQDAVTQFKTLLWGPVSITGGGDVNAALALFNGALDGDADAGQLQQLALNLAHVCGNEARDVFPAAAGQADAYGANSAILAQMREIARGPQAAHAAAQWLGLVDAGDYAGSWKTASAYFQATILQERWLRAEGDLRKLLGSVVSRKPRSEDYTKNAPGAPEGDTMVLQFDTSFAEKNNATETVTATPDKDGEWRISAYSIK